jgi:dUTP pyrophosphatase
MNHFEFVSKYEDCGLALPEYKTGNSAGCDFVVAEDMVIGPWHELSFALENTAHNNCPMYYNTPITLEELAGYTKSSGCKPSLVPTGVKCHLDPGYYLELSVRSSTPLKYWLVLANGVGIIDADYYNNPDNEGHIYFQIINLSPVPIQLKKGDIIGQGIIKRYYKAEGATCSEAARVGGFGSTSEVLASAT